MTQSQRVRAAYAECRRLARRHYENFPVASRLVPRDKRDALAAIYAFARYADDVADEPGVEGRLENSPLGANCCAKASAGGHNIRFSWRSKIRHSDSTFL